MNALDAAIHTRLASSTALVGHWGGTSIYSLKAPNNGPKRFTEFGIQGGGDENFTATRMKNQVVRVMHISNLTKGDAGTADVYADAAMLSGPLTISGWGTNFWLAREQDIEYIEVDDAKETFYHVGGLYRLRYNEV